MAAALCAATILQLRLPDEKGDGTSSVVSETFVRDCLRYRNTLVYSKPISTEMLLTSLFLHMYYANSNQVHAATFALRDAITSAHLLRLDDHITLESLPDGQRELRIRIFWVLFVTERTFCSHHNFPVLLQKMDCLPNPDENRYGASCSIVEFCKLVRLFTTTESLLPRQPTLEYVPPQPSQVKDELQVIYQNINKIAMHQVNMPLLQEVNIQTTRAWLQSLLWQRALSNFLLDSQASEIIFTPEYPFTLAKDLLGFLSKIPLQLIKPHAYAMVSRSFATPFFNLG
ncbi:hypothetical protein N7527_001801 [Penicillium freii]|uniref:Xylanolytic transcriptional activator regulatory domain-containing protein n=1 Tax=Penicillium freii TaxID=48697 RepID=A0A101M8D1_PENFR|nr:hypothetical protein N7527_001801 [Penicillium freii]KUM55725.1 hypothetical protein ACN42_g11513 [Penicillium freii]